MRGIDRGIEGSSEGLGARAGLLVQGLDDLLPPAPWPSAADAPASLRLTFLGATLAILVAVGTAVTAFVLPRRLRFRHRSLSSRCAAPSLRRPSRGDVIPLWCVSGQSLR